MSQAQQQLHHQQQYGFYPKLHSDQVFDDKSSQSSSQSPPPQHSAIKRLYHHSKLNKISQSPPPGNLLSYTNDDKSSSRSPKRRSSYSSLSSHSASDLFNNNNGNAGIQNQHQHSSTQFNTKYTVKDGDNPSYKISAQFPITRRNLKKTTAFSTKSVSASNGTKFTFCNPIKTSQSLPQTRQHISPLMEPLSPINYVRSKSNPNILGIH